MFQWLLIGLVIWYFYRRFKNRSQVGTRQEHRYIRDDDFRTRPDHQTSDPVDDDEYIDYEEVK